MSQTALETAVETPVESTAPVEAPAAPATPEPAPAPVEGQQPNTNVETQVDWREAFPPEHRELLSQFDKMEDAIAAIQRGKDYKPAEKIDDFSLTFPEGIDIPVENQQAFKQLGIDARLTPEQLQKVADWQIQTATEAWNRSHDEGLTALKQLWGPKYQSNSVIANNALVALDRKMGGRLSPLLTDNTSLNDPVIIEALYHIGTAISEDTLSGATAGSVGDEAMTEREFLRKVVFNNKIEE